jgi:uncharacterized protein YcfL
MKKLLLLAVALLALAGCGATLTSDQVDAIRGYAIAHTQAEVLVDANRLTYDELKELSHKDGNFARSTAAATK